MTKPTTQVLSLPRGTWVRIDARVPSTLRPAPLGTLQPTGQIYLYPGETPPPQATTAVDFPGIPSTGFGCLTLAEPGPYQVLYDGSSGVALDMILEPLDGREPPKSDEDSNSFFFRHGAVGSGAGVTLATGTAQTLFGTNRRRKALNLNFPDATGGGSLYLRFDGAAATATNHDLFIDLGATRSLQLTSDDLPKGAISALFVGTGSILVTGSQWV